MATIEKVVTTGVDIDRCFETVRDVLPDIGVRVVSVDDSARSLEGRCKASVSSINATKADLPIRCVCTPIEGDGTEVRVVYHNRLQRDMFVSAELRTKLDEIQEWLRQCLSAPVGQVPAKADGTAVPQREHDDGTALQAAKLAANMLEAGLSEQEIEAKLIQRGYDTQSASGSAVGAVEQRRDAAKKQMAQGVLWLIGGIAITVFTYSRASSSGGTYLVTWGPILIGLAQFLQGAHRYMQDEQKATKG